jgi:hypothetical protein
MRRRETAGASSYLLSWGLRSPPSCRCSILPSLETNRLFDFSKALRLLALTAAVALALELVAALPVWIRSLRHMRSNTVLTSNRNAPTIQDVSGVLNILAGGACVLTMLTIYRQGREEPAFNPSVSKLLRATTTAAVIGWGMWVAFLVIRLIYSLHLCSNPNFCSSDRQNSPDISRIGSGSPPHSNVTAGFVCRPVHHLARQLAGSPQSFVVRCC